MFKALLLTKTESGAPHCAVTELDEAQLPAGEVLAFTAALLMACSAAFGILDSARPRRRRCPMARATPPPEALDLKHSPTFHKETTDEDSSGR